MLPSLIPGAAGIHPFAIPAQLQQLQYSMISDNALHPSVQPLSSLQALSGVPMQHNTPQFHNQVLDPALQFQRTLELVVTQEIPKIEALARASLEGINHAYESHIDASQTAASLHALREALLSLYSILKESGLGALPLHPEDDLGSFLAPATGANEKQLEELTKRVNEIFKMGNDSRERATVVSDMLKNAEQSQRSQTSAGGTASVGNSQISRSSR